VIVPGAVVVSVIVAITGAVPALIVMSCPETVSTAVPNGMAVDSTCEPSTW
jgi:hypothetical protein